MKKCVWLIDDGFCILVIFTSTQRQPNIKGPCSDSLNGFRATSILTLGL